MYFCRYAASTKWPGGDPRLGPELPCCGGHAVMPWMVLVSPGTKRCMYSSTCFRPFRWCLMLVSSLGLSYHQRVCNESEFRSSGALFASTLSAKTSTSTQKAEVDVACEDNRFQAKAPR